MEVRKVTLKPRLDTLGQRWGNGSNKAQFRLQFSFEIVVSILTGEVRCSDLDDVRLNHVPSQKNTYPYLKHSMGAGVFMYLHLSPNYSVL